MLCRNATTFTKSKELDEEAFRKFLQRLVDAKLGVYLASGGSGEGHDLSRDRPWGLPSLMSLGMSQRQRESALSRCIEWQGVSVVSKSGTGRGRHHRMDSDSIAMGAPGLKRIGALGGGGRGGGSPALLDQ